MWGALPGLTLQPDWYVNKWYDTVALSMTSWAKLACYKNACYNSVRAVIWESCRSTSMLIALTLHLSVLSSPWSTRHVSASNLPTPLVLWMMRNPSVPGMREHYHSSPLFRNSISQSRVGFHTVTYKDQCLGTGWPTLKNRMSLRTASSMSLGRVGLCTVWGRVLASSFEQKAPRPKPLVTNFQTHWEFCSKFCKHKERFDQIKIRANNSVVWSNCVVWMKHMGIFGRLLNY